RLRDDERPSHAASGDHAVVATGKDDSGHDPPPAQVCPQPVLPVVRPNLDLVVRPQLVHEAAAEPPASAADDADRQPAPAGAEDQPDHQHDEDGQQDGREHESPVAGSPQEGGPGDGRDGRHPRAPETLRSRIHAAPPKTAARAASTASGVTTDWMWPPSRASVPKPWSAQPFGVTSVTRSTARGSVPGGKKLPPRIA